MANYIRKRHPGGTYFFTARLADRSSTLLVQEIDRLRDATRRTMRQHPFRIDAIAILPAVIHTIWTLPEGDADFSTRWTLLKSRFSRDLPPPPHRSPAQIKRSEKGIWQRRFWEHLIRDTADLERHIQMIHASPVLAGLSAHPRDWPHSSVHRDCRHDALLATNIGHGARRGAAWLHLTPSSPAGMRSKIHLTTP